MAFDYASLAATASALLTDFGETMTVSHLTSSYDPATDVESNSPVDTSGKGVFIQIHANAEDGIEAGDVMLFSTIQAQAHDTVTRASGEKWSVVRTMDANPAGTTLVYKALLRR